MNSGPIHEALEVADTIVSKHYGLKGPVLTAENPHQSFQVMQTNKSLPKLLKLKTLPANRTHNLVLKTRGSNGDIMSRNSCQNAGRKVRISKQKHGMKGYTKHAYKRCIQHWLKPVLNLKNVQCALLMSYTKLTQYNNAVFKQKTRYIETLPFI